MAQWFAIYATIDGGLRSVGTVVAAPLPTGLASTALDAATNAKLDAQQSPGVWNTVTHVFDAGPVLHSILTLRQFWDRWTAAEREALKNLELTGTQTQKNKLGAFKDYVHDAGAVDCNDPYIQTSVNLAESSGIIAAGRAAVILA